MRSAAAPTATAVAATSCFLRPYGLVLADGAVSVSRKA